MHALPCRDLLDDAGLNLQHVFDLDRLPAALCAPLDRAAHERQLILLGHAGRRLWQQVQAARPASADPIDDPIDDHSVRSAERWLAQAAPHARYRIVHPEGRPGGLPPGQHVGLQRLGSLAGWHHAAPFLVGIHPRWGSWFAYRVVFVTDTAFDASPVDDQGHPCSSCSGRPCIAACPARALDAGTLDMPACWDQRLRPGSPCALDCPARQACPVGAEHRYEPAQVRHGARVSLEAIRGLHNGPRRGGA